MSGVIDVAGAQVGGAARFLSELDSFLPTVGDSSKVQVLGRDRSFGAAWLVRREHLARSRRPSRVVAANNVSFVAPGVERVVLLRNALHFPLPGERFLLPDVVARRVRAEALVVRAAARRASILVVPSTSMAHRVQRYLPRSRGITVRPHPVTARPQAERAPGRIVCPVLFAPYKQMGVHLRQLAAACADPAIAAHSVEVLVTATPEELHAEGVPKGVVRPVGHLSSREADLLVATAQVVFYPTVLESFGYPLAEARANGQPVLAAASSHNAEVAGDALCGFTSEDGSLVAALERALTTSLVPETVVTPDDYFRTLLFL